MADVSLNGLKVKTDSLPNDWYVSLINPKDGEPAEIMTVAKLVELFTSKQPVATVNSRGIMAANVYAVAFKPVSLPTINDNIIGDISDVPTSYGWYNNMYSDTNINAPRKSAGLFIRFSNNIIKVTFYVTINNEIYIKIDDSQCIKIYPSNGASAISSNALTETVVEEVPVSANTPMTLQEDGQPVPTMRTVERYEYSIQKMAEMILSLRKELDELKGGAGKE